MKNIIFIGLSFLISFGSHAQIINFDASKWEQLAGPSNSRNTGKWIGLDRNIPEKKGNSSGSLVSNFNLLGDFSFTGLMTATTTQYDDNDIMGIVFGWQDEKNHYRLGWTQNKSKPSDDRAIADITGRSGLFLVKESNGRSQTLFNNKDWFWQDNTQYQFKVSRQNDKITFGLGLLNSPLTEFSLLNDMFINGRVGLYTESQTARFENLRITGTVAAPEPSSFVILLSGLFALMVTNKSRNKKQLSH